MRRSVVFAAPGQISIASDVVPQPNADQVLVESCVSAISAGTELLVYRGQMPQQMAVDATIEALDGTFVYPLRYGYATVGRIKANGNNVSDDWNDKLVFAFQPHTSHFVTEPEQLIVVPHGVSAENAAFLPNMETAVSFVMDARPVIGERVVVFGQGIVGLLTTQLLAQFPLAQLVTVDVHPLRREWSRKLGADVALHPDEIGRLNTIMPDGADVALELSGNPQALDSAIGAVGYGGRVLIGSWYGTKAATLDLGGVFHRNHIQLISSQVSTLSPRWRGRWDKARRLDVAWQKLGQNDPAQLITQRFAVENSAEAYRLLDQSASETVQIILTY
jgi:2-desacetyl-2-hydroxyethyl bacteriochlorophyllide A dehydrogenase